MKAPLIVIPTGPLAQDRWGLPPTYARALAACGALPAMAVTAGGWADRADGLLLAGGGDVEPSRYGQGNQGSEGISPERDALEFSFFEAFYRAGKPIFGICRGHQVINVALGGTLWQDVKEQMGMDHPYQPTVCHTLSVAAGSFLFPMLGPEYAVNSTHHQAVRDLAPGLRAAAWSENGRIVEALEASGQPLWSVQWHPERMMDDPAMAALLREFVVRCKGEDE